MKNSKEIIGIERKSTRWLVVFYDTVIYALCWILILCKSKSLEPIVTLYAFLGLVLFILARFVLKVYKRILRYGAVSVFARMLFADVIASGVLLSVMFAVSMITDRKDISFFSLLYLCISFIMVSLVARILYCYFFRFAMGNSIFAKIAKFLLKRLALVDFDSTVSGAVLRIVWESQDNIPVYINEYQRIVDKFAIRGQVTSITQMNNGYINLTYKVETLSDTGHVHKYVLQKINNNVFKDVEALMDNYKLITERLYGKLRLDELQEKGAVQTLRPTKDGRSYLSDDSGCWRMLTYFDNVYSMDIPKNTEVFARAGFAFGNFLKAAEDISINDIKIVIPDFHNTKSRYKDLESAIQVYKDGRVKDVQNEIDFIRTRSDKFGLISDALEKGEIPTRICHNDCNLNNILFDTKTDRPVAIIDLDTVMPSSPLYDFGDSMRIGTNTAKDDEKDLSKVSCNLKMYEHYARGYLKACGDVLTEKELELLPYAALIIAAEDGIRFLTDHICGDVYYHIRYPGQNLDRARTQLKLVEDMEKKLPKIKQILRKIYAEERLNADI